MVRTLLLLRPADWEKFGNSLHPAITHATSGMCWADGDQPGYYFEAPKIYPCMLVYYIEPILADDDTPAGTLHYEFLTTKAIRPIAVTGTHIAKVLSDATTFIGSIRLYEPETAEAQLRDAWELFQRMQVAIETQDELIASLWSLVGDVVDAWELGTESGTRPLKPIRISAHVIEEAKQLARTVQLFIRGHKACHVCGKDFVTGQDGVANHMLNSEEHDFDADADHVPYALEDAD